MSEQTEEARKRRQKLDRETSLRQKIWKLWLLVFAAGMAAAFTTSLSHAATETRDQQETRSVIEAQLEAFRQGDGVKAFSYAAPTIQTVFGDADTFMQMVRKGYDVVLRPASVKFVKFQTDGQNAAHALQMIDQQKVLWNVYYVLQKAPDGQWKISSCETEKAETKLI